MIEALAEARLGTVLLSEVFHHDSPFNRTLSLSPLTRPSPFPICSLIWFPILLV